MSIPDPAAADSEEFRKKLWDGRFHFLDSTTNQLPSGLLPRLLHRLEKRGHEVVVQVTDKPEVEPVPADYLEGVDLRAYQLDGVNIALAARRGLLWQATNAGKSEQIAAIAGRIARDLEFKVLAVVPNQNILKELWSRLRLRLGTHDLKIGRHGSGFHEFGNIVVATYQTGRFIRSAGAVLVDEAHHAAAPAYEQFLKLASRAWFRIGFTGTADKGTKRDDELAIERSKDKARLHRWKMEQFLGPVLHRIENKFMIDQGFSARPRIIVIDDRNAFGPDVPSPKGKMGEDGRREPVVNAYGIVFGRAAVQDKKWLRTIAKTIRLLIASGKPPFVFSHSIDHLMAIRGICREREIPCRILSGVHSMDKRTEVLKRYVEQKDFAILTSTIFDEGANVPEIRAIVLAGARKATVELLQRVGRGIRRKDGDNTVIVVDFVPRQSLMLLDHARERLAVYSSEGFKVTTVTDATRLTEVL